MAYKQSNEIFDKVKIIPKIITNYNKINKNKINAHQKSMNEDGNNKINLV